MVPAGATHAGLNDGRHQPPLTPWRPAQPGRPLRQPHTLDRPRQKRYPVDLHLYTSTWSARIPRRQGQSLGPGRASGVSACLQAKGPQRRFRAPQEPPCARGNGRHVEVRLYSSGKPPARTRLASLQSASSSKPSIQAGPPGHWTQGTRQQPSRFWREACIRPKPTTPSMLPGVCQSDASGEV